MSLPTLSYDSSTIRQFLKAVAEFECVNAQQLSKYLNRSENSIRRTSERLQRDGFINRARYDPYEDGILQDERADRKCYTLTDQGAEFAAYHFPNTDPVAYGPYRKPENYPHELKRAQFHITVAQFCDANGLDLSWRKTNLKVSDKMWPDDSFRIGDRLYFFEEQNRKRTFLDLLAKYTTYESFYGKDECLKKFGSKTFTVITQIANEQRLMNLLDYLTGKPTKEWISGRWQSTTTPHRIERDNFWFSTEQNPLTFFTPKDYPKITYTLS